MTNTTLKTIKVLHTPNGNSIWEFCTTTDNCYIARKNGYQDIKIFRSWDHMIYQYNQWLEFTNHKGQRTFLQGYPTINKEIVRNNAQSEQLSLAI